MALGVANAENLLYTQGPAVLDPQGDSLSLVCLECPTGFSLAVTSDNNVAITVGNVAEGDYDIRFQFVENTPDALLSEVIDLGYTIQAAP